MAGFVDVIVGTSAAIDLLGKLAPAKRKKRKANPVKKPTAKQLAARKLFAQRAKAGTLRGSRMKNPTASDNASGVFEVLSWKRERNSSSGNPRYSFTLRHPSGMIYQGYTKANASFVYGIGNQEDQIRATIKVTPTGRVQMTDGEFIKRGRNPLSRVSVNSPPQRPKGTRAKPSARLVKRRKKTARAPQGFYANPGAYKYALVINDGGFSYGMDSVTPVHFEFSSRDRKRGVYRSFEIPSAIVRRAEFQDWVKGNKGHFFGSLNALRAVLKEWA